MSALSRELRSLRRRYRWRRGTQVAGTALIWWGSFRDGGGATIGDLHAVRNLSDALTEAGHDHAVLTNPALGITGHRQVADLSDVRADIATLVFVCGPLARHDELADFLDVHRDARKLAVGVSVLARHREMAGRFDAILARDGLPKKSFDLAVTTTRPCVPPQAGARLKAALCFRGNQSDYGKGGAEWEKAEGLLRGLARTFGMDTEEIDTVLRPGNDTGRIERQFAAADLVLTTRLHGSLFGLAGGKPVIAIDQIAGTGKVKPVLGRVGWPAVFEVEAVDAPLLEARLRGFVAEWPVAAVSASQEAVARQTRGALSDAVALIGSDRR